MRTNPTRDCLAELTTALTQPGDAWRIASLATVDIHGHPQVRKVVLRAIDLSSNSLVIFTDRRSGKIADLMHEPTCSVLLWCSKRQQQWRLSCCARLVEEASHYWQNIANSRSIRDYATTMAPGTALEEALTFDLENAAKNFCVLELKVCSIDRLWLSKEGHRRQRISADGVQNICP